MHDGAARTGPRRVLVVDPQPIFRLGLVALLESAFRDWDVAESDSLSDHRAGLRDGSIDLLIVDSRVFGQAVAQSLPAGRGLDIAADIIAVTEPGDTIGAFGCLGAGARATVCRSDPTNRTLATIENLPRRPRPDQAARVLPPLRADPSPELPQTGEVLRLTARQFDVLRSLAKGQSNKVIARDLGLSVSTVKVHLNTVFRALGARNRVEAVIRARPFQQHMLTREHHNANNPTLPEARNDWPRNRVIPGGGISE
jgi:DNA-binding NarL/FixJ family response regulator